MMFSMKARESRHVELPLGMVLAGTTTTHDPSELLKDLKNLKVGSNCCFRLFGFLDFLELILALHVIVIRLIYIDDIVPSIHQCSPPFVRTTTHTAD